MVENYVSQFTRKIFKFSAVRRSVLLNPLMYAPHWQEVVDVNGLEILGMRVYNYSEVY